MSRKARRALAHTTAPVTPVTLAAPVTVVQPQTAQPPRGSVTRQRDLYALANKSLQAVTPARISAALRELEFGRLEQWADLITQAKRDPTMRRAYGIRRNAVAGRKYTVKAPPDCEARWQREAERLAKLTSDWLLGIDGRETFLMRVLDGIGMGVSVHELVWDRQNGAWLPAPAQVLTRELRWERDWTLSVRNADSVWINTVTPSHTDPEYCRNDTPEQRRARWLIHIPWTEQGRPQDQGEFQAAIYYWAFKVNTFAMWLIGAERFGNPLLVIQAAADASKAQLDNLLEDGQRLTTDSVAVLKGATTLQVHDPKASGSTPIWSTLRDATNEEITTALGVAPDLMKSGPNGSRAADTVKDGIRTEGSELDATLMWGSIVRDCVREIARLNRFDPAVPIPVIESVFDNALLVPDSVINAGLATHDEIRAGASLPPKAEGGDVYYRPIAATVTPGSGYDPAAPPDGVKVADAALNGAQADQLQKIVINVASGLLPRDAGISMLMLTFQIDEKRAQQLMGSAGAGFVPAPPTDLPTTEPTEPDIAPLSDEPAPAPGGSPAASPFPRSPDSAHGMPSLLSSTPISPTSSPSPTSPRRFARVPRLGAPTS